MVKLGDKLPRFMRAPVKPCLWVEPTNFCNLKCKHCFNSKISRQRGFIDLEDYKRFIIDRNFRAVGLLSLTSWGESLLHPGIVEMIDYAAKRGLPVMMPTNAVLLSEAKTHEILNSRLSEIRFSIDGFKESYEFLRQTSYDAVYSNVMAFLAAHKRRDSKMRITFVCVVNDVTAPYVSDWVKFWNRYGGVEVQRAACFGGVRSRPCSVIGQTWYVWHNLDVSPCCMDFNGKIVLGNLKKQSFKEVMGGPVFRRLCLDNQRGVWNNVCAGCVEWDKDFDGLSYRFQNVDCKETEESGN